jgi:hypothetical protein
VGAMSKLQTYRSWTQRYPVRFAAFSGAFMAVAWFFILGPLGPNHHHTLIYRIVIALSFGAVGGAFQFALSVLRKRRDQSL